jgi:hypothetical protein
LVPCRDHFDCERRIDRIIVSSRAANGRFDYPVGCLVLFYKLKITIERETLCASFGLGIIRKRVPMAEIAGCELIRIRWWYGWGIHLTPYGWLYNVSGLDAVAITLRNGRKFALGTDDPHGLLDAIRRFASAR